MPVTSSFFLRPAFFRIRRELALLDRKKERATHFVAFYNIYQAVTIQWRIQGDKPAITPYPFWLWTLATLMRRKND